MKIFKLLPALMVVALNVGLTSCEKDDPQEEPTLTVGEFTVNREVIGVGQAIELSCPFEMGTVTWNPTIYCSLDGGEMRELDKVESFKVTNFDPLNGSGIMQMMYNDRKTLKIHINGLPKGEHQIECQVMKYDFSTVIAQKSIKFIVVDADVRSSFWGETLEDTKRSVNLTAANGHGLYHTTDEAAYYGTYIPYSGKLEAFYQYTDNKLTEVVETQKLLPENVDQLLVNRFLSKVDFIKAYTPYKKDVKCEVIVKPGGQIEERYQGMLDNLLKGTNADPDNGKNLIILGDAILSGNIGLKYTASSGNTSYEYILMQNEEDEGISDKTTYLPLL